MSEASWSDISKTIWMGAVSVTITPALAGDQALT
jgi:hypothetical protein